MFWALFLRSGYIDLQLAFAQQICIEQADRLVSIALITHRDKSKAFGFAADAVFDNLNRDDLLQAEAGAFEGAAVESASLDCMSALNLILFNSSFWDYTDYG